MPRNNRYSNISFSFRNALFSLVFHLPFFCHIFWRQQPTLTVDCMNYVRPLCLNHCLVVLEGAAPRDYIAIRFHVHRKLSCLVVTAPSLQEAQIVVLEGAAPRVLNGSPRHPFPCAGETFPSITSSVGAISEGAVWESKFGCYRGAHPELDTKQR